MDLLIECIQELHRGSWEESKTKCDKYLKAVEIMQISNKYQTKPRLQDWEIALFCVREALQAKWYDNSSPIDVLGDTVLRKIKDPNLKPNNSFGPIPFRSTKTT